jgi:hypothetical protein
MASSGFSYLPIAFVKFEFFCSSRNATHSIKDKSDEIMVVKIYFYLGTNNIYVFDLYLKRSIFSNIDQIKYIFLKENKFLKQQMFISSEKFLLRLCCRSPRAPYEICIFLISQPLFRIFFFKKND